MIHRQSITIRDYVDTKEAELNFWVAVAGITVGIILGILLLRSLFQVTLSEQTLIETPLEQEQLMYEPVTPFDIESEGISV